MWKLSSGEDYPYMQMIVTAVANQCFKALFIKAYKYNKRLNDECLLTSVYE